VLIYFIYELFNNAAGSWNSVQSNNNTIRELNEKDMKGSSRGHGRSYGGGGEWCGGPVQQSPSGSKMARKIHTSTIP
jgi:hypothetical protein